jgi:hypothetical protein
VQVDGLTWEASAQAKLRPIGADLFDLRWRKQHQKSRTRTSSRTITIEELKNDCDQRETGGLGLDFLSPDLEEPFSFFNHNRPRTRPRPRFLTLAVEVSTARGR